MQQWRMQHGSKMTIPGVPSCQTSSFSRHVATRCCWWLQWRCDFYMFLPVNAFWSTTIWIVVGVWAEFLFCHANDFMPTALIGAGGRLLDSASTGVAQIDRLSKPRHSGCFECVPLNHVFCFFIGHFQFYVDIRFSRSFLICAFSLVGRKVVEPCKTVAESTLPDKSREEDKFLRGKSWKV